MHKAPSTDHSVLMLIDQDIARLKGYLQGYSSDNNKTIESLIDAIKQSIKSCQRELKSNVKLLQLSSEIESLQDEYNLKASKGIYGKVNKAITSGNQIENMFREKIARDLSVIQTHDRETYHMMAKTSAENDPITEKRILAELPTPPLTAIFSTVMSYANLLNIFSACKGSSPSVSQVDLDSEKDRYTMHASALKEPKMNDDEPTREDVDRVMEEFSM